MEALDRRALSRALTKASRASAAELIRNGLPQRQQSAHRIGITGPPGAGKSTLISRLATARASDEHRVGVLAIDPSSPLTGGAILGDRVRMDDIANPRDVYIRSFASGRLNDGLTANLPGLLDVMDEFAFDDVFVETVGVGQVNHAISVMADTVVVVLVPESGDTIQAMKAGILEIADIYVVNKADRDGAGQIAADLESVLSLGRRPAEAWQPKVLLTSAERGELGELSDVIDMHQDWVEGAGDGLSERRARARYLALSLLGQRLGEVAAGLPEAGFDQSLKSIVSDLLSAIGADGD